MAYNKRHKNTMFKRTIRLGLLESDKFSWDDLINVLPDISFSLININLTMKKSEAGINGNGYIPIGFVNKFYSNEEGDCLFDVAIFDKFKDVVESMEDTENTETVITARVFTNKENKITKIIGLDLRLVEME